MNLIIRTPSTTILSRDWLGYDFGPSKRLMHQIEETYPSINLMWHDDLQFALYNVATEEVFIMPDEDDLLRIEREHAWIQDMCGAESLAQFQASFEFMSLCRKTKSIGHFPTTYGIKHDVESVSGIYISEGALIRGALLAGFTLKPMRSEGGCRLNILADDLYYRLIAVLRAARERARGATGEHAMTCEDVFASV